MVSLQKVYRHSLNKVSGGGHMAKKLEIPGIRRCITAAVSES
ncbi:hypothetical protein EHW99_3479 [Erwinia amylovora]|uniref:Uncharacterized protein n=2 Tax=Erwinia amylovora TaxID=552 RepID=A0A831ELM3_ERWAM|nr:hypothetical protein EaACW_3551 [Erwinia amylovora ACW56400]QJQ56178.1 hypothetical protein EHX00_3479 [Erwinia amylovora]CBA23834.1 hypothetical protein predicted by Glimmer/Critica [Erwinia amylovora CFBP1430]CCO80390.1 hypothetical protein BN432_3622 [Erwinia amylovora Ea356]CCO84196.1 hypothetical protein BN433_3651 [Erwinia amylovora Ea266]CCO87955.1 hypothetical protein BN434_3597 [Erwinia amylovora CFBP 2585]CCO91744.1 hypothetical protein BN435_3603 [Erwinia amylovora 01SFR-BO]CCO